jgi:hypothetical protein
MKRLLYIALSLVVACTSTPYPSIDRPSTGTSSEDRSIIAYIDQRLATEYYWLDEVVERSASFDRGVKWEEYLSVSLGGLKSNADDGYVNSKGQRVLYSYIREYKSSTRSKTMGFGIGLHYTIAVIDSENQYLGFLVDNVYADSPAHKAGVKRGDVITMVNRGYITQMNYAELFKRIENNSASAVELSLRRQTDGEIHQPSLHSTTSAFCFSAAMQSQHSFTP